MSKKTILFLRGLPDDKKVIIESLSSKTQLRYQITGSANIAGYVDQNVITPWVVTFDTDPKQEIDSIPGIHAIFNEISDPDTHLITLSKADIFYKTFSDKLPFFNAPADIMKTRRDNIYRLLQNIDKLHVPKTVKIQPKSPSDIYNIIKKEGFEYPVIFRQAEDHNAVKTIIIKDDTELFYAYSLDGRDYYLTQFIETAQKGIYSKYRLAVVDGEIYIRHILFSKEEIVNNRKFMEENQEFQKREETIFQIFDTQIKPEIQSPINEIYNRLKLDYFGIDCTIDEAFNITLFEANTNMNILANFNGSENSILTQKIQLIQNAVTSMLAKK